MGLWGNSNTVESRPKFLPIDSNAAGSSGARENIIATEGGWGLSPGLAASGNDNADAQPEVLVCIRNLGKFRGSATVQSIDWTQGQIADTGTFDITVTFDEAVDITSATRTANQTVTNKAYILLSRLGQTDMVEDSTMACQYFSGSGTNQLTFRGRIPAAGEAGGYIAIADATAAMATDGSSAMVDGNGTTVANADADHAGGSAAAGADGASAIWGTAITRTGSTDNTLRTVAGSSSGTSSLVLTGVVLG